MASNTVTFCAPAEPVLSMACPQVAVEVGGLAAPWLALREVVRRPGPQLNEARLTVIGGTGTWQGRFEEVAPVARVGQPVRVWMVSGPAGDAGRRTWPLFTGVIRSGYAELSGGGETVDLSACDQLVYEDTAVVDGVRAVDYDGQGVFLRGTAAVFNPRGRGNASRMAAAHRGMSVPIFELNESAAVPWTYAGAVRYLAAEHLRVGAVSAAALATLDTLTAGLELRDVDVTGLSALAAIARVCQQAGIGFHVAHVPGPEGQIVAAVQFYRYGQGRTVLLRHQPAGEALDLRRTNVQRCTADLTGRNETIRAIGRGDWKRFEGTFELVRAWDGSLEADDYEQYTPLTNEEFFTVRDVFRKWALNEAGDYTAAPYGRGPAYDFATLFGTSFYSKRRRRFWPCLSRDWTGMSLGYFLEVSYDSGATWQAYAGACDNLLDECGIYLSSNQLGTEVWTAASAGTLRFRVTASVVADERLEGIVYDGPLGLRRVRTVIYDLGPEYAYRQVTPLSVFAAPGRIEVGGADTVDDRQRLLGRVREQIRQLRQEQCRGSVVLPWLRPDIAPGDVVRHLSGREVNLAGSTLQAEHAPQVRSVRISLGQEWATTVEFGAAPI